MRKTLLSLIAIAALLIGSAQAAERQYFVTSADGSGSTHSLWIKNGIGPMIGSNFRFDPAYVPVSGTYPTGSGMLILDDMTAMGSLVGSVYSTTAEQTGFDVNFSYDKIFLQPPGFKSENGSMPGADIEYWDFAGGTLTGFGLLEGLTLDVERLPLDGKYAFQFGSSKDGVTIGPNNKNTNLGGAHWFVIDDYSIGDNCKYCIKYRENIDALIGRQGDININAEPVPIPAPLALMLSGLAGLIGFSRRSSK